jgi:hypothetical protein
VILFWANPIWHVLSRSIITFHQKASHKKVIFQVNQLNFGGKIVIFKNTWNFHAKPIQIASKHDLWLA